MDKNNLKSFMGKMNDMRETNPVDKSRPKKVVKGQRTAPKKPKKTKEPKEASPRENRQQIMEQHERKRQEAVYREDERVQNIEATRAYWQEAMMLAEIVGPPVCKRRGRRRPGSL